ncbi:hypothetical protein FQZ97_694320 [compost metagenome]
MGAGLRTVARGQSGAHHGAAVRLRADGADEGPAGLRRDRRIHGRPAVRFGPPGPAAAAGRHLDRRFDRRAARRDRRHDGAAPPRRHGRALERQAGRRMSGRAGADGGRGPVRGRVQHDGKPGARIRRGRRRARTHGRRAARYRAFKYLHHPRRPEHRHRRQRRRDLPPADAGDRPGRPGVGPRTGAQRWPRQARGRDRRRNPAMVRRTRHRRSSGHPEGRRRACRQDLQRGRHVQRSAVPGAPHDRAAPLRRRQPGQAAGGRSQTVGNPWRDSLGGPGIRGTYRGSPEIAGV